jgi:uncharacterized protein
MRNLLLHVRGGDKPATPWLYLLILLAYVVLCLGFFGNLVPIVVVSGFYGWDFDLAMSSVLSPYGSPDNWLPLILFVGISSTGTFIIGPMLFAWLNLKLPLGTFFSFPTGSRPYIYLAILMFCFMVVNSVFVLWNQNLQLPEFMSGAEQWMQAQEAKMADLTNYLTAFSTVSQLLLGLLIIAIIPGIGEELLFRGILQNLFGRMVRNPHVVIWFTAFLFSAIHMQFYGLIPRMLLGALFGYLYYWSGYLGLAMLAHAFNNGLSLLLIYAYQQQLTTISPVGPESVPQWWVILLCLVIGILALTKFKAQFQGQLKEESSLPSNL